MKVVGTGTPQVASVRFEACEIETVRAEVDRLQAELVGQDDEELLERLSVEAFVQRLEDAAPDLPLDLEGPFDLMRAMLWSGLDQVADDLRREAERAGGGRVDGVLRAAATAYAWAQTLADLDHVENRGLQELDVAGALYADP